ncbi:NADPH-dependent FMN reductase [Kingella oralis]|jgi:acyl carrier protein phosphodiesterase|uniref:NADPH-dependent FMN reductase n=1 Tax=Kingella oralis TaxID=505 RepID=UPI0034E4E14A
MQNILIIVGSLAKQSFNRKIGEFIAVKYADCFHFTFADIGDLPLYTQDRDENSPESYQRLRQQIKQADGVLIISPEHNRSLPAALKNVIDIASRPMGEGVWSGKPIAIITASPAMTGAMAANHAIRQCFVVTNGYVMPSPEAYYGTIHNSFNEQGELVGEHVVGSIDKFIGAFGEWIKKFA